MKKQTNKQTAFSIGDIVNIKGDTTHGKVIEVLRCNEYRVMFGDYNHKEKNALRRTVTLSGKDIEAYCSPLAATNLLNAVKSNLMNTYSIA